MTAPVLLSWPKARPLRDADTGTAWVATIAPGRLLLSSEPHGRILVTDPDELRAFAMQVYVAAIDYDLTRALPPGQGRAHLKRQRRRAAAPGRSERDRDPLP